MPLAPLEETPSRVLAVFAHPDDSDVACGGALARWSMDGSSVHLIVCTLGDKGSVDAQVSVDQLIAERAEEIDAASEVLGIESVHRLGYRDGEFENDLGFRAKLVTIIRELQPDTLVCPDPLAVFFGEYYYNHRDHRVVGFAALDAAAPAAASRLYFPDGGEPFSVRTAYLSGSLEPNVYVDISKTIARKADAVMCHSTQIGESGESMRELFYDRARETGQSAGVAFAEAFRRIQLSH